MAVLTRADWGAGPHRAPTIRMPVSKLVLHHSVTPEWVGATAARNLQRIARERKFADISYSWLVDVRGNLIEGRGWGRQGAHTQGHNSTAHAICLVGNFESTLVGTAMIRGVAELVRRHDVQGHGPDRITHGHRDLGQTACPGRHAYNAIPTINRLAREGTPPPAGLEHTMFCKLGDTGPAVGALQLKLRALGLYDGDIDEDYGPATSAAVLKARKRVGSSATSGDTFGHYAYWQVEQQVIAKVAQVPKLEQAFERTSKQNVRLQTLERMHYPLGTDNRTAHPTVDAAS